MEEGREEGGFLVESELLIVKKVQKMSVDLVECCGGKKSLEGELPLARLTKLLPILRRREDGSPPAGWLRYELRGERDAAGRNFVHLRLSATLPMICQRCTGALEWKLNGRRQFLLQDGRASLSAAERQEVEELDGDRGGLGGFFGGGGVVVPANGAHAPFFRVSRQAPPGVAGQ